MVGAKCSLKLPCPDGGLNVVIRTVIGGVGNCVSSTSEAADGGGGGGVWRRVVIGEGISDARDLCVLPGYTLLPVMLMLALAAAEAMRSNGSMR